MLEQEQEQEQKSELELDSENENENNNVVCCEKCDKDETDCSCECPHCGDVHMECDYLVKYSASDMTQGYNKEHTDSDNSIQMGEETKFGDFIDIKEQEQTNIRNTYSHDKIEIDRMRHRDNKQSENGNKKRIVLEKNKENLIW